MKHHFPPFRTSLGRVLGAALALALSPAALALKSDQDQPADIRARTVDADERTDIAVYRGDVRYVQGSRRIEADTLDVEMKDGAVERAKATGRPVTLRVRPENSQHDAHATAERLEYRHTGDETELFDAVTLRHQPDDPERQEMLATADRALYRAGDDTVELFGRVILQQGGDVMSGGYARYDLQADRIAMRGGEHTDRRVYAVIQPRKKKTGAASGAAVTEPKP